MKPTETLIKEHDAILVMLQIAGIVCDKIESGESVNPVHLDQIVEFIREFADKCHHGKEEAMLFKAMEEAGIPRQGGPIGVMLKEHDMGREFVGEMSTAAGAYRGGDDGASMRFAKNARGYIALLSQHIHKENQILFPMADARIPADKQDILQADFDRFEQEEMGSGRHEQLHGILDHLTAQYLT